MTTEVIYRSVEWLTFRQVRQLLENGQLKIVGNGSETELYIQFIDRSAAQELAAKLKPQPKPEKEET